MAGIENSQFFICLCQGFRHIKNARINNFVLENNQTSQEGGPGRPMENRSIYSENEDFCEKISSEEPVI